MDEMLKRMQKGSFGLEIDHRNNDDFEKIIKIEKLKFLKNEVKQCSEFRKWMVSNQKTDIKKFVKYCSILYLFITGYKFRNGKNHQTTEEPKSPLSLSLKDFQSFLLGTQDAKTPFYTQYSCYLLSVLNSNELDTIEPEIELKNFSENENENDSGNIN